MTNIEEQNQKRGRHASSFEVLNNEKHLNFAKCPLVRGRPRICRTKTQEQSLQS